MIKPLIKTISFYVGVGLIFLSGLLYILLADIVINTQSLWLMLAMLFAFGSAICLMISDNFKDGHKKFMYSLKGIAIGLGVCFVGVLLMIMLISFSPAKETDGKEVSAFVRSFTIARVQLRGETGKYLKAGYKTMTVYVTSIVIAFIGLVAQVLNLVMTVTIKEE